MTDIKLTYTKKSPNKYQLLIKNGNKEISNRIYTATPEDHELYSGFVKYLNEQLVIEQETSNFSIDNVDEFRAWANSTMQRNYLNYIDSLDNR